MQQIIFTKKLGQVCFGCTKNMAIFLLLLFINNKAQTQNISLVNISALVSRELAGSTKHKSHGFNNNTPVKHPMVVMPSVNGFKYNTTNFDDGWTATVQENWVAVTKPGIAVLIHHPNELTDIYFSNKIEGDYNAWRLLITNRYTNITNFLQRGIQDYQSITFLTAHAVDKTTGKSNHIVLYKKHYDKGHGRYIEVVADNQSVFEKEFGNNYINSSSWSWMDQATSWNKLADMQWRNKFAIDAADLIGEWASGNTQSLSYYYTAAGGYAGATATSVADKFTFLTGNKYQSNHNGASGVVGNLKFSRVAYNGKTEVSNWVITVTNRHEGVTEKFDSFFEAVKGGRILHMRGKNGHSFSLGKLK